MDRADQEGDTDTRALLEEEARNIEKTMEEVILDGTDVDVDVLMQMPMDLQQASLSRSVSRHEVFVRHN